MRSLIAFCLPCAEPQIPYVRCNTLWIAVLCRSAAKLALQDYQGALADAQQSVAVDGRCVRHDDLEAAVIEPTSQPELVIFRATVQRSPPSPPAPTELLRSVWNVFTL
jgi:hypothetical protein